MNYKDIKLDQGLLIKMKPETKPLDQLLIAQNDVHAQELTKSHPDAIILADDPSIKILQNTEKPTFEIYVTDKEGIECYMMSCDSIQKTANRLHGFCAKVIYNHTSPSNDKVKCVSTFEIDC